MRWINCRLNDTKMKMILTSHFILNILTVSFIYLVNAAINLSFNSSYVILGVLLGAPQIIIKGVAFWYVSLQDTRSVFVAEIVCHDLLLVWHGAQSCCFT